MSEWTLSARLNLAECETILFSDILSGIGPLNEQLPREKMEEKLHTIYDRLQSLIGEICHRSLWVKVYVIRRSQLDRLQSLREEIRRILDTLWVNVYGKRGRQLHRLQSLLEKICGETLSANFHVITRWELVRLQSLLDEIQHGSLLANMYERCHRFESELMDMQVKRHRQPARPGSLNEKIGRESLSVSLYVDTCRLVGSVPVNSYEKRCSQLDCLQTMLEEIRGVALWVDLYVERCRLFGLESVKNCRVDLVYEFGRRLPSMLAELSQIRQLFWVNLYDEIFGKALSVNVYVKGCRELGRLQSLSERCRQLDRPELLNDAGKPLDCHSIDDVGPPPGGGGLQQQRQLLVYTEVRRGGSIAQAPTGDVKGKDFMVENEAVQLTAQGSVCDLKCKHFGVEYTAAEPSVQAFHGDLKVKTIQVEEEPDEPRVELSGYILKDKPVEDEADETNAQGCLNAVKDKVFEEEGEATKPNVMRCYIDVLVLSLLTFALFLPVATSTFLEVPKNAVVSQRNSPNTIEMACKSDCQCPLRWFVNKNQHSEKEDLYNGYHLRPDAKSYCTVTEDEPGKYYLNLKNQPDAAQTYICFEPGTSAETSAELIWLGDLRIQNENSTDDVVNLTCSIEFRGNWAPMMEWKEHSSYGEKVLSVGVNTTTVPNQRVTSTIVTPVQEGNISYICTVQFDITGKPTNTIATNVPDYKESSAFPKSQGLFGQIMKLVMLVLHSMKKVVIFKNINDAIIKKQ